MKVKSESEVSQSCPTLSDPMDYSPFSMHGIFQARVLEWGTIAGPLVYTRSCLYTAVYKVCFPLLHFFCLFKIIFIEPLFFFLFPGMVIGGEKKQHPLLLLREADVTQWIVVTVAGTANERNMVLRVCVY